MLAYSELDPVVYGLGCFIFLACGVILIVYLVIRTSVGDAISTKRRIVYSADDLEVIDGPGRYRVTGVDKASKMDTTWMVKAESRENAKVKGEMEGIIVTAVDRA